MNRTRGRRARAPATGPQQQGPRPQAMPAADAHHAHHHHHQQVPLFGPPVAQPAMPSAEQIALKRQRLTTTFDPLNPPGDDATTAQGVRMGVVLDQDGRHWRQQSMRLGRWVTHWKDTFPFPSEPVDVDDLSKAEKYWLDIKFRRRIPQRKVPIKQAAGRGCTGRYMASRRGNRGVLSGRVGKTFNRPSSGTGDSRADDSTNAGGPPERRDDIFGQPPVSFNNPPPDTATQFIDPPRKTALFNQVLAHHGIISLDSTTLDQQVRGLLPDDLFRNGRRYPTLEDIPSQNFTAIANIIRGSQVLPGILVDSDDDKSPPGGGGDDRQQSTLRAQARLRRQFERDILKDAGLSNREDLPKRFWDALDRNLQGLQDFRHLTSADFRAQMAAKAAAAAATPAVSGGTGNAGNTRNTNFGTGPSPGTATDSSTSRRSSVFISAAQAAADQNHYWTDAGSNSLLPRPISDSGHRQCSEGQIRRILVRDGDDLSAGHAWVQMRQADDNALVYVRDDRTQSYIPLDRGLNHTPRVVNLRLRNGTNVTVGESLVGTAAEHDGAVILGCDPIINNIEWPSNRLVRVQRAGTIHNVADNKLGAYIGGRVNPADEADEGVPIATGRTVHLRHHVGMMLIFPASDVDNFQHGGMMIAADSEPPANVAEQRSERMIWIHLNHVAGTPLRAQVHDNDLGLFSGWTISPPKPILPDRVVRLKETSRTVNTVPVSELTNWGHQGRIIVDTVPAYDSLETPSSRLIHIRTRPDMVDLAVPDNQLGRYPGAVIRPEFYSDDSDFLNPYRPEQVPIDRNRLVVLRLPNGGPQVRIPVASASSAHYLGATIVTTIPVIDRREPPSETTVHVSDHGAHFDVPDNQLSSYHGWVISTVPDLTKNSPEKAQTGTGKDDSTQDREGRANDTTQKTSRPGSSSSESNTSSSGSSLSQSKTARSGSVSSQRKTSSFGSSSSQTNTSSSGSSSSQSRTPSLGSASIEGRAPGRGKTSTQDQASRPDGASSQAGGSTPGDALPGGKSTPGKDTTQTTPPSTQDKASTSTQRKGSTQGNDPAGDKVTPKDNASKLITPPTTQGSAGAASTGSDDWETDVDYATNINAPEFISPTKKDLPDGRPDRNGNLPQPRPRRPRRGDPDQVEHLRRLRDRLNRMGALREYLTTDTRTDTGSESGGSTRLGSLVGAVTVRAGSAASSSVGSDRRSMIQGTSRSNLQPTAATATAAAKSSRVQKRSGKSPGTGRNVRFGPLPTEADTGRERGVGLRTRSGALYGKQRRSGKGI